LPNDTRDRILQAAFAVLSRQGYENTSIKEIAEEAGVAQGLVHYYFKSKQQLVLGVLAEVCMKMQVQEVMEGEAGAMAAFENFKAMLRDSRATHALYLQLIAVGIHDKEIGAGILDFVRTDRAHTEDIARKVLAERELSPSAARPIAGVVWGAILGIMIQHLVDPEFNADEAVDALAAMSLAADYPSNLGA